MKLKMLTQPHHYLKSHIIVIYYKFNQMIVLTVQPH